MSLKANRFVLAALGALWLAGCKEEPPPPATKAVPIKMAAPEVAIDDTKTSLFAPLPEKAESTENPVTDDKVALGRALYFDARLSKGGALSCSSCHDLDKHGVDPKPLSAGAEGKPMARNTPTVLNAAVGFAEGWTGRAETIEAETRLHLLDPAIYGQTEASVATTLKGIAGYADLFTRAFPGVKDAVSVDNATAAIGAFTRKLLTPSPWDKFLKGDKTALTNDQKKGFLKFVEVGCPTCHLGALVGATMYQKLGKEKPWPDLHDKGRVEVTKSPADESLFKVAQLRNVVDTGPYLHDGSMVSLEETIQNMARYQLAKELSKEDAVLIITWLGTLSGPLPKELAAKPDLPGPAPAAKKP